MLNNRINMLKQYTQLVKLGSLTGFVLLGRRLFSLEASKRCSWLLDLRRRSCLLDILSGEIFPQAPIMDLYGT